MHKDKRKLILTVVISVFILTIFSAIYFVDIYGTSWNDEEQQQDAPVSEDIEETEEEVIEEPEIVVPQYSTTTIAAVGDIMFHSTQVKAAYDNETGTYDFKPVFEPIKKYIDSVDLAIANFETVTAGPEHGYRGYPTFNSPADTLDAIKYAGFDILSTANNHSLDKGKEGIIETIDNINNVGLISVGTYKEPTSDILIQNVNGINLAILSYTYGLNGLDSLLTEEELSYMVNLIDENKIKSDIERADTLEVDSTLVIIHWGNEYQREPSEHQINLANKMIEWGADIILGSHPHVIQKSEIINYNGEDKYIIYSMGNFVSNQRRETLGNISNKKYTEDGVIVQLQLEKNLQDGNTIIKEVKHVPTWVNRYMVDGKLRYEIMPVEDYINAEDHGLTQEVFSRMVESYNDTINIMGQK